MMWSACIRAVRGARKLHTSYVAQSPCCIGESGLVYHRHARLTTAKKLLFRFRPILDLCVDTRVGCCPFTVELYNIVYARGCQWDLHFGQQKVRRKAFWDSGWAVVFYFACLCLVFSIMDVVRCLNGVFKRNLASARMQCLRVR